MMNNRPRGGRRAQAAANDETILHAAREVFLADPSAPIAAVAQRAGVGISALYRRYSSKHELVATLCAIGQETYLAEVERALAQDRDPWDAWVQWLRRIVDADTHALVVRLAGTFTPTPAHLERAERIRVLGNRLFSRTKATRAFRPGLTFLDVNLPAGPAQLPVIRVEGHERDRTAPHHRLAVERDHPLDGVEVVPAADTADRHQNEIIREPAEKRLSWN